MNFPEIRSRLAKASPGPWEVDEKSNSVEGPNMTIYDEGGHSREDAEFIAHARQDIPLLLAEVDALRNALEEIANPENQLSSSDMRPIAEAALARYKGDPMTHNCPACLKTYPCPLPKCDSPQETKCAKCTLAGMKK